MAGGGESEPFPGEDGRKDPKQLFGRTREPRKACQSPEGLSPSFLVNLLIPGAAGQGSLTREGSWWQDPIYFVGFSNIHTASLRNLFKFRTLIEGTAQAGLPDSRVSYVPILVLLLKQCPCLVRDEVTKRQSITYSRCPSKWLTAQACGLITSSELRRACTGSGFHSCQHETLGNTPWLCKRHSFTLSTTQTDRSTWS